MLVFVSMMPGVIVQERVFPSSDVTPVPTAASELNLYAFPYSLYCSDISTVQNNGPEWEGIQIGASSLNDFDQSVTNLRELYRTNDLRGNQISYYIPTTRLAAREGVPVGIMACILDNTVWLLRVTIVDNPPLRVQLSNLIAEYGLPNAVTWSEVLSTRIVFWFEDGVAAEVGVYESEEEAFSNYGDVLQIIYFPYQSNQNYEAVWPYNRTRVTPPSMGDEVYDPPLPTEQNPFDFSIVHYRHT
jgi:hypothetical protein